MGRITGTIHSVGQRMPGLIADAATGIVAAAPFLKALLYWGPKGDWDGLAKSINSNYNPIDPSQKWWINKQAVANYAGPIGIQATKKGLQKVGAIR